MIRRYLGVLWLMLVIVGCVRNEPEVIIITATFLPTSEPTLAPNTLPTPFVPAEALIVPTANPARAAAAESGEYVVQAGDTLSAIAASHGVTVQALQELNNLANANTIFVGQTLRLPALPQREGSAFKILPDSRLVRAPGSRDFNIADFISRQPGYVRSAAELVDGRPLNAAQIIERVSLEYSVDARLLLMLLELLGGWLSNPSPSDDAKVYPMRAPTSSFGFERRGLYLQTAWAADQLNRGYYAWRQARLTSLAFTDSTRVAVAPTINAGTAGVQYMLSLVLNGADWERHVGADGLYRVYVAYLGDPFAGAIEPLVPSDLTQPPLTLPFAPGEVWYYTGGPHGGWGSGSAWAAVDFAPPDDLATKTSGCYVSDYYATAVANGVIARTDVGTVILDLDGDGDESTGWSILYLHIASDGRAAEGTTVKAGDRIGRPSCEGGVSNGTHMHLGRRYNGEWIPAWCDTCTGADARPAFVLGGWSVTGIANQEYQGYLVGGGQQRIAEQGRHITENQVSW